MRYIVAIAAAVLVLLLLSATTGFGDWPRPWGPLSRGAVGGAIAIGVLIIWEQLYPREDSLTEEEKERIALEDAQGVGAISTVSGDSGSPVEDEPAPAEAGSGAADDAAPAADGTAPSDDEDPRA
ncbi:hypothetical protein [Brevibacterium yomogidense]|uniref:Uncharacterized protein n=1 Tax=Brevibacterium yomogidense TaxID=946573 RepID=A0A1X6XPC8_9MICO|nr:hypothetical protein [Brevibacterium yomogidense]SLN00986.1 hypothetical protein FM105_13960 [Brevibacterium yomogidense]